MPIDTIMDIIAMAWVDLTVHSATITLAPIERDILDSRASVHLVAPDFPAAQ